jgi:hypothetical protein
MNHDENSFLLKNRKVITGYQYLDPYDYDDKDKNSVYEEVNLNDTQDKTHRGKL